MVIRLAQEQFDALVDRAVDTLPGWVGEHMRNVYITTAPWPTLAQRQSAHIRRNSLLLGLYEGVPLTRRGGGYNLVTPDRITLFQRSLELVAEDEEGLQELIRSTIVHEIAHHFGFSDEELHQLEQGE